MAKKLNKNRLHHTRLAVVVSVLLALFTAPLEPMDESLHVAFDMVGSLLVGICALGRVYCTAFLGGYKNQSLITYGPFSMTRNPLYFCSFMGACGIAMISNHFTLMLVLPILYLIVYMALIRREEAYLLAHFGEEYRSYCNTTPRFFPKLSLHQVPEAVSMQPKFISKALKHAVLWFGVLPLFELVERLQETGLVHTYFTLP